MSVSPRREPHHQNNLNSYWLFSNPDPESNERFYEKVVKVKADVAALLSFIFDVGLDRPVVSCGAVQGAPKGR